MSLSRSVIRQVLNRPMSLADLQQATQVSLPTLRRAVQDLTAAGWIRVVGQAEANGGRPAMLFGVDTSRFLLIGVHLQLPGMRLVAVDLTGDVLDGRKIFDRAIPMPTEALQAVADYVEHVRTLFPDRVLLGVGIASPGFTDLGNGDIISIGRVPSWENFPICRRLQAMLELPVLIANDVDCMAFAEFRHASEPLEKNLAYAGYDEGVKVSLFLNGGLYKGSLGNVGLVESHLLHAGEGLGVRDVHSLLTVFGVNQRFEQIVAALERDAQAPYASILDVTNPRERFRLILNCEDADAPVCAGLLQDLTAAVSAVVANVMLMVQPDIVVIGGLLSAMPGSRFTALESAIRAHLPALVSHNAIIRQGRLASQNGAAIGATLHFVQLHLTDPSMDPGLIMPAAN